MSSTNLNDQIKTILITGGTGLIGAQLSEALTSKGYTITHLSRNPTQKMYKTFYWNIKKMEIDDEAITTADAIIHLAGAGVSDKRWSSKWKKEVYDSRINSTKLLRQKIFELNPLLKHFISASAIGYYGCDTKDKLVNEESEKGEGFLSKVTSDWEKEVDNFKEKNMKISKVRIGIVLSKKGGALVEMMKSIKFGVGAPLGSGTQFISWIHIQDLCKIFIYILENSKEGVFNGVAPAPITNKKFIKSIADKLHKPLWLPNIPKFVLQLMLGEMACILIGGNLVSSIKIKKAGFNFQFISLDDTLNDLLK